MKAPRGIFVDINDSVYVSFDTRGTVLVWSFGNDNLSAIYHRDKAITSSSDIYTTLRGALQSWIDSWKDWIGSEYYYVGVPNSLFVTFNGDIYVSNDDNNRIDKWTRRSTRSHISLNGQQRPCYGLFIDINDVLYCSVRDYNKIIRKSLKGSNSPWGVIAENSRPLWSLLNKPYGIFVNNDIKLYEADSGSNKIQIFDIGRSGQAEIVKTTTGISGLQLDTPTNIALDADNNLYIVDSKKNRIVFVDSKFEQYRCLIGCIENRDKSSYILSYPIGLSFDSSGNIFVSDTKNNRIQKFILKTGLRGKFNI